MRRTLFLSAAALALGACADGTRTPLTGPGEPIFARGSGAHFIRNATGAEREGDNLIVNFKEAGLPAGSSQLITASALATATYQCVNRGGNVPADPKKTTDASQVSGSGEFTADKNGNVVGFVVIEPPPAPATFSCPNGQNVSGPLDVSFSNVSIKDETSGAFLAIRGEF
jgi:hypothetical protein